MRQSLNKGKRALMLRGSIAAITGVLVYSAGATANAQSGIDVITVTAQKRSESLQEVPITVQAYNGDQLRKANVTRLTDITKLSPNLNVVVQNALSQHIVIRGVGTNEFFGNAPSSVGLYMDEVSLNSSYLSTLGLFDMERVEILRGPQNSLFGRNTTGGAVNYISKLPNAGDELGGYGVLTWGEHKHLKVEGGVTLPMTEDWAIRVSGFRHVRDGVWNNLDTGDDSYGDERRYSMRVSSVWQPTDQTKVTISMHHARANDQAQPQKVAGALLNNPPLRINDLAPFDGDIDWAAVIFTIPLKNDRFR